MTNNAAGGVAITPIIGNIIPSVRNSRPKELPLHAHISNITNYTWPHI